MFSILLKGVAHIGARASLIIYSNLYGLAISLAYLSGEEGGLLLVHIKTTCLRRHPKEREGESAPCGQNQIQETISGPFLSGWIVPLNTIVASIHGCVRQIPNWLHFSKFQKNIKYLVVSVYYTSAGKAGCQEKNPPPHIASYQRRHNS